MKIFGLRSKLVMAFFLAAILPFSLLGYFNFDLFKDLFNKNEKLNTKAQHLSAANNIQNILGESFQVITKLEYNEKIKSNLASLSKTIEKIDIDSISENQLKEIRKKLVNKFEQSENVDRDKLPEVIKNLTQLDNISSIILNDYFLGESKGPLKEIKNISKNIDDELQKIILSEEFNVYAISKTGRIFYSSQKRLDLGQKIQSLKEITPSLYEAFKSSKKALPGVRFSKWGKHHFHEQKNTSYLILKYPNLPFSLFLEVNGSMIYDSINFDNKQSENFLLDSQMRLISKSYLNDITHSSLAPLTSFIKDGEQNLSEESLVTNIANLTVLRKVSPIKFLNEKLFLVSENRYDKVTLLIKKYRDQIIISGIILMVVSCLFGFFIGKVLSSPVLSFVKGLRKSTGQFKNISGEIEHASQKLSESTTEQGAAIESTVTNLDEMTAMLTQTEVNVRQTIDMTTLSREQSAEATYALDAMLEAMEEIEGSNIKLAEIENLMDKIHEKTEVINEIVAETRLLSFNASIEAARAGSHGKGFAVVAEEIGKLASMSGKAAEEITNLIESSTGQVKQVVSLNKDKVSQGKDTSKDCELVFKHLNNSLLNISKAIDKINMASMEQSTGIQHTNKAMVEMESITQQNSDNAGLLASKAGILNTESETFNKVIEELNLFLDGASGGFSKLSLFRKRNKVEKKALYEKVDTSHDSESKNIEKTVDRDDDKWNAS
ncbi:MAG: methyl-accepting chemotaxis protein [Bacteriovoracaceae bacterium]